MTSEVSQVSYPNNADRARWARHALEAYQGETGFFDEPADCLLRYLIADLGHLATEQGVAFLPIVAHAEAYWLQESASANERPKTKL